MVLKNFFKKDDGASEKKEQLKKIQNDRVIATQAVEDNQALYREIGRKLDAHKAALPALVERQSQAERAKKEALGEFVVGRISQAELDAARLKAEAAKKTQEESIELLEALEKAKGQAERALPGLHAAKNQAARAFWLFILEDLKSQLDVAAKDLLMSCYAARLQAYPGVLPHPGCFFELTTSKGTTFGLDTPQGMATLDIEARGKIKELEEAYGA